MFAVCDQLASVAEAELFVGLEGSTLATKSTDLSGFPDVTWENHFAFDVSGAAAAPDGTLYVCNGAFTTRLYRSTDFGTPVLMATLSEDIHSMAFGRGGGDLMVDTGQGGLVLRYFGGPAWKFTTTGGGERLLLAKRATDGTITPQFAFDPGGYLGVGTTEPTNRLHVAGTARADQFLVYQSNNLAINSYGTAGAGGVVEIKGPDGLWDNGIVLQGQASSYGGQYLAYDSAGTATVQINADGVTGGAAFFLGDGEQTDYTVMLDAAALGTGSVLELRDTNRQDKVRLYGAHSGGELWLYENDPGVRGIVLDGDSGDGGAVFVYDHDGYETITSRGDQTSTEGALVVLRNGNGVATIELDADRNGGEGWVRAQVIEITGGSDWEITFHFIGSSKAMSTCDP